MNIFIDTNVLLSFYHLTSDDLEELRKLLVLIEKGDVKMYLPQQVVDEYRRNRENKIAAALKGLKEQKLNLQFPTICKDYEEYPELREHQKQYETKHAALTSKLLSDIEEHNLKADEIIEELCAIVDIIEHSDEILNNARTRIEIGNPPGKRGSLGDAINWETLLESVPDDEDLYIVADDRDYFSPIDESRPDDFLVSEWADEKDSEVKFYRRLSPFFKDHYPEIKLATELEKELAVQAFSNSSDFATTHSAVRRLNKLEGFSGQQANGIVSAALSNNQVNWIICDGDVLAFLSKIAKEYKDVIEDDNLEVLLEELDNCQPDEDEDDELPF